MHPRNLYRSPPEFASLADVHEPLKPFLITDSTSGRTTIDFKNEDAQRRLTEAIMLRDFGITLHIPPNRLCPPVPNRLNYVLWIQDIIHAHDSVLGSPSRLRKIRGLDIGTGSTVIYPFLACQLDTTWEMVATEIDDDSYESAKKNLYSNNMESRIRLQKASTDDLILFPLENAIFDFSMCNPPFYGSALEVAELAAGKELPPNAICTGADIEMIYPDGGEAGFVGRMVEESCQFQARCKWYTSMLGKMSSLAVVVEALRQRSITNYAITEFIQGQTHRWAIAWSFSDTHLLDSIARIQSISSKHVLHSLMPPRNTLSQPFPSSTTEDVRKALSETLRCIDGVSVGESEEEGSDFFVEAQGNTWSRSARRRRKPQPEAADTNLDSKPALTCRCRATTTKTTQLGVPPDKFGTLCSVEFQWVFGASRSLFESFVGHVGRKVGSALPSTEVP